MAYRHAAVPESGQAAARPKGAERYGRFRRSPRAACGERQALRREVSRSTCLEPVFRAPTSMEPNSTP